MAVKYVVQIGDPGEKFLKGSGWVTDSDKAQLFNTKEAAQQAIPNGHPEAFVNTAIVVEGK